MPAWALLWPGHCSYAKTLEHIHICSIIIIIIITTTASSAVIITVTTTIIKLKVYARVLLRPCLVLCAGTPSWLSTHAKP